MYGISVELPASIRKINNVCKSIARRFYLRKIRCKLRNRSMSVISSNCVGGCVLSDLKLPFRSPFVNLFLNAKDFIKYLKRMEYYNSSELIFIKPELPVNYPVAKLDDITIHFVHYDSAEDARNTWTRRLKRLNTENLFVILVERDGCSHEDLIEFDALPFRNKVVFTHKPYADIQSAYHIKGFEGCGELGNIVHWTNRARKYYDDFDFVGWFNDTESCYEKICKK